MLAATRVEVVPDPLAYVTAAATVLAAVLALVAIIYTEWLTRRERKANEAANDKARQEAARDRRIQWELSILAEMSRQYSITGTQHLSGYVRSLIRHDAPDEELPILRTVTRIHPTELGREQVEAIRSARVARVGNKPAIDLLVKQDLTVAVGPEIIEAINRRLP